MTAPARPLEAFVRAAGVLSAHGDVGVQSIGEAMRTWLSGGTGPKALEAALGLKRKPGEQSLQTANAYQRRNGLVREMARRFHPHLKAEPAAKKISEAIQRYRAGPDWRRDKAANEISYLTTSRGFAWAILKAIDTPLSPRRIRTILAMS